MNLSSYLYAFIFIVFSIFRVQAQELMPDSTVYNDIESAVIDHFNTAIGNLSEIYSGPVYELSPPANKGSFYFEDKNYVTPGFVRYNDTWYKNVPVLYDVHAGVMVSVLGSNFYILQSEKLSDVILLSHHFIYLPAGNSAQLTPGFYDLLYDGSSRVFVKRTKIIRDELLASQAVASVYENKSDIYVKKGNIYILVNNKGSLLSAFSDKRKEIDQYIKKNKLDYKGDIEGTVKAIAAYYDLMSK